ncbi:hypothetical protein [Burkholderia cenocepacia]|uniref:hypothetical protein n=1 Tax=Burkholderia cenocepacia TaxID=95486 RepID=UPI002B246F49|nr:hypothetical protein [Burkholderia cenocepacia]MEB2498545.1 hypothetical protein [Burkholderia cenocepacia]MEB2554193.1 hypothetical protein [Burkholderia cenocepacia]
MSLNNSPSIEELRAVFAAADDDQGHHMLWVDTSGQVHLSVLPEELGPIGFEQSQPTMRMRYETFQQGNGYVGAEAAADDGFMGDVLAALVKYWGGKHMPGRVTYMDGY